MRQRLIRCIWISAAILVGGCAYALFCRRTGWGIPCPFHAVTGLNCPGCGVSRMLLSLLRLDFRAAFRHNAVLLCMLPLLLALIGFWIYRYIRFGTRSFGKRLQALELILVVILVVWGVVRNVIGM